MDSRSVDSFSVAMPFSQGVPTATTASSDASGPPRASPGSVFSQPLNGLPASPRRSRSVRIAVEASDLPHTQGSVSRVDLPSLARKLHVPIGTLSRSLSVSNAPEELFQDLDKDYSSPQQQRTPQRAGTVRMHPAERSSSIGIRGMTPASSPNTRKVSHTLGSSLSGSVREWFSGSAATTSTTTTAAAGQPPLPASTSRRQRDPQSRAGASPPVASDVASGQSHESGTFGSRIPANVDAVPTLAATTRPSVRVRYVPATPVVLSVPVPRGNAEFGVLWEMSGGVAVAQRVQPGSAAAAAGLQEGMRLLSVEDTPVQTQADLVQCMARAKKERAGTYVSMTLCQGVPQQRTVSRDSIVSFGKEVDDDVQSDGSFDTASSRDPFDNLEIATPAADVEVEVHENGAARVINGQADSAYLVNGPAGTRPYFAMPDREQRGGRPYPGAGGSSSIKLHGTSPGGHSTGADSGTSADQPPRYHSASQRPSFFGSLVRGMSGILGFAKMDEEADPLLPSPVAQPKRHVYFADDKEEGDGNLITSVRHYEEIDTVLLELRFVFPKWVWVVLALTLAFFVIPLPIMLRAHEHGVSVASVLGAQSGVSLAATLVSFLCALPWIRHSNYSYLRVDYGWLCVLLAAVGHAALSVTAMLALVDNSGCHPGRHCPPVVFECLCPVILVGYFAVTRYLHRRKVGQSEPPFFAFELVGMLLSVAGAGILLARQAGGLRVNAILLSTAVSFSISLFVIMGRRIASQLPVPFTAFLVQLVSSALVFAGLLASRGFEHHDPFTAFQQHPADMLMPGLATAGMTVCALLILCYLHPYPMAAIFSLGLVLSAVGARAVAGVEWDNASNVAIPAGMWTHVFDAVARGRNRVTHTHTHTHTVLLSCVGTLLATWANVHHRSVVEVEILQEKKLNRRKASGIKGPRRNRRKRPSADCVPIENGATPQQ